MKRAEIEWYDMFGKVLNEDVEINQESNDEELTAYLVDYAEEEIVNGTHGYTSARCKIYDGDVLAIDYNVES